MFTQKIDEKTLGKFLYQRFEGASSILGQTVKAGRILPSTAADFVPQETIFYFHGGDGDDQQFLLGGFLDLLSEGTRTKLIERRVQIVCPFIGLSYLKNPHDRAFREEVMPWAEEGMNLQNRKRWLHGVSMGGTAAFNLFLKNPELFDGIASNFTGLITFNPFDEGESKKHHLETGITDEKMGVLRYCYTTPFSDFADFRANDPLQLLKKADPKKLQGRKIYFDVGRQDDFGLVTGAQKFNELLNSLSVSHQFFLREGGHDFPFIQKHLDQTFENLLN